MFSLLTSLTESEKRTDTLRDGETQRERETGIHTKGRRGKVDVRERKLALTFFVFAMW